VATALVLRKGQLETVVGFVFVRSILL